jgi:undecaprenyl pyrophosphate phosphatase UppP
LLIYRRAARPLAIVLATLSAIFALLSAGAAILHPDQVRGNMDVLTLMFGLVVVLPGILAVLLFSKRITLRSMQLRPLVTPEQKSKFARNRLRVLPILIVWLCYGVYRAVQSGASTAPLRLFAIVAMALILGFDLLSDVRKNLNSSH